MLKLNEFVQPNELSHEFASDSLLYRHVFSHLCFLLIRTETSGVAWTHADLYLETADRLLALHNIKDQAVIRRMKPTITVLPC